MDSLPLELRLLKAAEAGSVAQVFEALQKATEIGKRDFLVETTDSDGWTALHYAVKGCDEKHAETVGLLLGKKADVNAKDVDFAWTPLHVAAQFASEEIIEMLLDWGADRYAKDTYGNIPLKVANGKERARMLERPAVVLGFSLATMKANFAAEELEALGLPLPRDYKPGWATAEFVVDMHRQIADAEKDVEGQEKAVEADLEDLKKQMHAGSINPIELAKKSEPLLAQQAHVLIEKTHVTESKFLVNKVQRKVADDEMKHSMQKVASKLARMRASAVTNERVQMKVNQVGYRDCVEILRASMAKHRKDADEYIFKACTEVCLSLEQVVQTGVTPKGFRTKLEEDLKRVLAQDEERRLKALQAAKNAKKEGQKKSAGPCACQ